MATRTVTVCDICGAVLEMSQYMRMGPAVVGSTFDGHRNENDIVELDLCPLHYQALDTAVDNVEKLLGGSLHSVYRSQAVSAVLLVVRDLNQALAAIPTREDA